MVLLCTVDKNEELETYQMENYAFAMDSGENDDKKHDECLSQFKHDHPNAHVRRSSMVTFTSKLCRVFFIYTE